MSSASLVPTPGDLLWPTLKAVRELGDSGTIEEIVELVISLEAFTDAQQQLMHGAGPESEIEYRLAWARTYLKKIGALENSKRGVWSTTELGRRRQPPTLPRPSRRTNTIGEQPALDNRLLASIRTSRPTTRGRPRFPYGSKSCWPSCLHSRRTASSA